MDRQRAGIIVLILFATTGAAFTSSPFDKFNSENPDSDSTENFELQVNEIEKIPASKRVAYGRGHRINTTISLPRESTGTVLLKYKTKRGTAAGGPALLYDYKFMDPGDKIDVTLEQNHEENQTNQIISLTYIPVKKGLEEKDLENTTAYRISMFPERYPEYVTGNKTAAKFKFNPQQ